MKKDNFKTDVIFRKEKDNAILAVFPHEIVDCEGNIMCYAHVGQHSGASYDYVLKKTVPASETEYIDLKTELESIGYNLRTIKRRNYKKYLTERNIVSYKYW